MAEQDEDPVILQIDDSLPAGVFLGEPAGADLSPDPELTGPIEPVCDLVTVVENVYYQPLQGQTEQVGEAAYSRSIQSHEQPFVRRFAAGESWKPLPCGWIDHCGLLILANDEGRYMHRHPSPEEKATVASRVVELAYTGDEASFCWLVLPGETMRGYPSDASKLVIRCRKGTAQVTLTLLPE